jgi:multiple sugar transport system permease protein
MTKKTEYIQRALFTAPAIVFVLVFMAYPIVYSLGMSFTNFDGINPPRFTGIANYIELFTSMEFTRVALNNLYFAVLGIPLSIVVPFVVAVLLFERARGHAFFKVAFLIPSALSVVIVGMLFRIFFSYGGPIHRLLCLFAPTFSELDLWSSGLTSIPIIILAMTWATFGVNAVIFLSAMSLIPLSVYESCALDGFSWLQKLYYITLPMIMSVVEFVTVMSVINVFSSMFGYIYTITGGGPGYESTVLEYLIFIKGFRLNNLAYASATSSVLFVFILLLTVLLMRFFARKER